MNLNYKQSQFELFPSAVGHTGKSVKPPFLFSSLTLTLENVIISGIFLLMLVIFMYSLGVEKGKKIAYRVTTPPVASEMPAPVKNDTVNSHGAVPAVPVDDLPAGISELTRRSGELVVPEKSPTDAISHSSPSGVYTIQVASFKKTQLAEKEAQMLRKKGYEIFVIAKGKYAIVCVGKFSEKGKADVALNRLMKTYKDSIVRRL